jgi:hypothetical protein
MMNGLRQVATNEEHCGTTRPELISKGQAPHHVAGTHPRGGVYAKYCAHFEVSSAA